MTSANDGTLLRIAFDRIDLLMSRGDAFLLTVFMKEGAVHEDLAYFRRNDVEIWVEDRERSARDSFGYADIARIEIEELP